MHTESSIFDTSAHLALASTQNSSFTNNFSYMSILAIAGVGIVATLIGAAVYSRYLLSMRRRTRKPRWGNGGGNMNTLNKHYGWDTDKPLDPFNC